MISGIFWLSLLVTPSMITPPIKSNQLLFISLHSSSSNIKRGEVELNPRWVLCGFSNCLSNALTILHGIHPHPSFTWFCLLDIKKPMSLHISSYYLFNGVHGFLIIL
ncbi:unnamed protein product [Lupinus luteus]|uniref:Secreted protein n=1 Tax=Lupinus luteus TaxID=3873 RepID=A0AAV1WMY2_LUPLU